MYPIDSSVAVLFEAENVQVLRITGTDKNGRAISITENDVMLNGFNVDRYSCNGERLEIGTAIAAEMDLKLNNEDGAFDSIVFEGTELFVEIGVADWTQDEPTVHYIPIGYFTPDEQPRRLTTINLKALDRMVKFDSVAIPLSDAPWTTENGTEIANEALNTIYFQVGISFPTTVANLVDVLCNQCGVTLAESIASLPNASMVISKFPDVQQDITMRNLLQWCAGIMGTNAWIDWNGELRFSWYNNVTDYNSIPSTRYKSDLYENQIVITGVSYTDRNQQNTKYIAGADDYALDLSDNYLLNENNVATILTNIYNVVHDYAYTPFSASVVSAPWLWPMDRVTFADKGNVGHVSTLTNVAFGLNGATAIASSGVTSKQNSYANTGSFTSQQGRELTRIQQIISTQMNDTVNHATEMITGGLGGYVILKINETTGQTEEILIMDTPDINTAVNVWRFNQGGLGHSSNGYEGPFNDIALTADGQINANLITTGILNASLIRTGTITDATGQNYWILNGTNSEFVTRKGNIGDFTLDAGSLKYGSLGVGGTGAYLGKDGVYYNQTYANIGGDTYKTYVFGQGLRLYRNNELYATLFVGATSTTHGFTIRCYDADGNAYDPIYIRSVGPTTYKTVFVRDAIYVYNGITALGSSSFAYVNVSNNLTVSGTKSRVVSTGQYSDRLLYCYETPSPMFGDVGEGVIGEDRKCYVWLDAVFAQTITTSQYQVFLQKYGSGDCWVSERRGSCFVVEGTPGLSFGWELKAKQADFDQRRLDTPMGEYERDETNYGEQALQYLNQLKERRLSE